MDKLVVAKVLIDAGADVNSRNRDYWTPLHWAARRQDFATMRQLVTKGVAVNPRDGSVQTPLMWAATYGNTNVAQWLLAHGADPSLPYSRKQTARDLALVRSHSPWRWPTRKGYPAPQTRSCARRGI